MKIKNAKPKSKPYRMADGEGLQLIVRPNGKKFWQLRYKFAEKPKTQSLGRYPVVSLNAARSKKLDALRLLDQGIDPSVARKKEKREAVFADRNSFLRVAEDWYERNRGMWTEKHAKDTWNRLSNHALPILGGLPISHIKPLEMLDMIQAIEAKGATHMSHRVLQICGSIFTYAIITGRAEQNVTIGLSKALKPHRAKHYPALRADELPEFLKAMENLKSTESYRMAIRLLLLTAVRTGELRHGRWQDVSFERKEWRIPAEFTKMRTEHLIPLSSQSMSLLRRLHELTGDGEWLFPTKTGWHHEVMSENAINDMIAQIGYKGRVVGHGFRSMFSTTLNEHGFNRDAIERQLAHMERNRVRAAYNRAEYLDQRREIMQWWSDFLDQKMKG